MIPRTIHQLWIGPPMPDWVAECMASWPPHHEGWAIEFWDEGRVDGLRLQNRDLYDNAETISPGAVHQFRSDVARYEILHTYGGVWVDADMTAQKPLPEKLATARAWMAWEREGVWLNNAIMGAEAGTPFLDRVITDLPDSTRRRRRSANTVISGPQFITPIALEFWVTTVPQAWFYPYSYTELGRGRDEFPDAYAVHHWHNRRRLRGAPL